MRALLRTILISTLLTGSLVGVTPSLVAHSTALDSIDLNLIPNPGFEMKTAAPVEMPARWIPNAWGSGSCMLNRDGTEAVSGGWSGRVACTTADDARWTQVIPVRPQTNYTLSGWIRTENVAPSEEGYDAGANLSVLDTWLHTTPLLGTNDWTYVNLTFNSGDSNQVVIAARLGFYSGTTTGTAWFDDVRLVPADISFSHQVFMPILHHYQELPPYAWKTLVLVYRQTDVTFVSGGQTYHLVAEMSDADILRAWQAVEQFAETAQAWSGRNAYVDPTIVFPDRPIESLSGEEDDYWVAPEDVLPELDAYAPLGVYDTVVVLWRADDGAGLWVPAPYGVAVVGSFCGSNGAGYTAIYIPPPHSGPWGGWYPEEVFIHEWTHLTIDFYWREYGVLPIDIDAPQSYGYEPDEYGGWRTFLSDVMQGQVWDGERYIGIMPEMWQTATPTWPFIHDCLPLSSTRLQDFLALSP
ncbi:MAG: hypothetical protein JXA14_13895 [Anaerolineae bacterium]|nr:hypothetical protein [Anaerolineae bacterium]